MDLKHRAASKHSSVVQEERTGRTSRRWGYIAAFLGLPLLVTFWLYWPTLSEPYFWDDAVHLPYVMSRSFLQLWTNAEGLAAYYRPIPSSLYKVLIALQPPGSTLASHAVVLLVHTANAWLTGYLMRRLLCPSSRPANQACPILGMATCDATALLAALLFACYPYAALPVAHTAAIMHPLVTLLMLGTALGALSYVRGNRVRWLAVAIGLAVLAPFVHESGIVAGTVALLVVALDDWASAWRRRRSLWSLPLASALFLPIWLIVPKMPNPFQWLGLGGILASVTFFTQGLTFPFQPISRLLINWLPLLKPSPLLSFVGLPWWVIAAMWGVALGAIAIASLALLRDWRWRILGVAVGWTVLAALPSILALPFSYITVSQRLMYSSAPGAAVLWAAACASLAYRARRPIVRGTEVLVLVACIVTVPVMYVRREMALHELALQPLKQLASIARTYPTGQHLVINAVDWVNHRNPWYALGQEGVSVSAPYIDFATLVWLNSRTPAHFSAASFPAISTDLGDGLTYSTIGGDSSWTWGDVATQALRYDHVWITNYSAQTIAVEDVGWVRQGTALLPAEYLAGFGDGVFLTSATLEVEGSMTTVNLEWKVLAGVADATIFRHVYDCEGHMLAQGDGFALGRTLRFELLEPGIEVRDIRHISTNQLKADDCIVLGVGLFLPDGTRVAARGVDGLALENNELLVHVVRHSGE